MFNSLQELAVLFFSGYGIWCFIRDGKTALGYGDTTPSAVTD
jgi:hypothetical protein